MEGGTATPAATAAATTTRSAFITINMTFISSISCALYMVEFVFGLICWSIIASASTARYRSSSAVYVLFTGVTSWLLTIILIVLKTLGFTVNQLSGIPWPIVEMGHHSFWGLLYFIASCIIGANAHGVGKVIASAVFGFFTTIAHIIHALFCLKDWRGSFPWQTSS